MEFLNKINGSLCFTKILENGKTETHYDHNQITSLLENIIIGNGIGGLFSSLSGSNGGTINVSTPFRYVSNSQGYIWGSDNVETLPTLYLLNLTTEEQTALNKNMSKNPLLKPDLTIDYDKLVGWASFDYVSTEEKKGTLSPQVDVLRLSPVVDGHKFGVTLKWVPGKLNGTFNTVVLGTNIFGTTTTTVQDPLYKLNGCSISKGLDIMNPVLGETAPAGDYLCPNVSTVDGVVMTGPNEILLGGPDSATTARVVLNLLTGETQDLATDDPRYNAYLYSEPHTYIGDGRILTYTGSLIVHSYLGTQIQGLQTLNSYCSGFIVKDNIIYTMFFDNRYSTNIWRLYKYDIETLAQIGEYIELDPDSENPTYYNTFGYNYNWYITNFMDKYALIYDGRCSVIFTDPENIIGSVVGTAGDLYRGSNVELRDTDENVTDYRYLVLRSKNIKGLDGGNESVITPAKQISNIGRTGVKMMFKDGWYGQVFTYSILDSPVTVEETEGLLLDYMFHF